MFDCVECKKRFKTKTSLTRHAHNHSRSHDGRHTCTVCQVRFRRRDLLARHEKIHSSSLQIEGDLRSRRRCHTACIVCRSERKRCNGELPCSTCVAAGESCSYPADSRRISQAPLPVVMTNAVNSAIGSNDQTDDLNELPANLASPRRLRSAEGHSAVSTTCLTTLSQPSEDSLELSILQQSEAGFNGIDVPVADHGASMDHDPSRNMLFERHSSLFPESSGIEYHTTDVPQSLVSSLDPFLDDVSWPWTHQSIYFQEGLGMYSSDLGHSSDQFNLAPNYEIDDSQNTHSGLGVSSNQVNTNSQSTTGRSSNIENDEQSDEDGQATDKLQNLAIETIVSHAFDFEASRSNRTHYWAARSHDVQTAFMLNLDMQQTANGTSLLDLYVGLYFEHFHPLWPLLWKRDLVYGHIHPVLYLVLVSIGTMYNGPASQRFGSKLHEKLRNSLFMLPLEIHQSEKDLLQLGCSLLLTQVAALYFEQQHAFSAAQRLGGMLVALAHRLELFSPRRNTSETQTKADVMFASWIMNESRKRLAYGIMRGESFISVLLNVKPLVDYEQMNLELPVSDQIWSSQEARTDLILDAVDKDQKIGKGLLFSDLVRIALDNNESLPLTKANEHELLLFGLQHSVWRFSHDPDLFFRLTGREEEANLASGGDTLSSDTVSNRRSNIGQHSQMDYLDFTARKMNDLRLEKHCVLRALEKWKRGLVNSQLLENRDGLDSRSVYLSSTLLYHLSILRLHAPVSMLQQAAYGLSSSASCKRETIERIYYWTRCSGSATAVEHACAIWRLIEAETSRPPAEQARYNILALIGVHQASVTVWAFASVNETSHASLGTMRATEEALPTDLKLSRDNIGPLLTKFVNLYPRITPAWGMQSSFSKVALNMSRKPLPLLQG